MSKVLQHKVVAALPSPLEPDSIYYVRKGAGFDIHVTNGVGVVTAYSLNANLELDGKVDKELGYSLLPNTEITRLATIHTGATKNRADSENADKVHPHTASQVTGLGTAATMDAVSSYTDVTAGRLLQVGSGGWMGYSLQAPLATLNQAVTRTSTFGWSGGTGFPAANGHGLTLNRSPYSDNHILLFPLGQSRMFLASSEQVSGNIISTVEVYTTGNTTKNPDGTLKASSPVINLYTDNHELHNEEQFGAIPAVTRKSKGVYEITGTLGLRSEGWYLDTPSDRNGNKYFNIEWAQNITPEAADGVVDEYRDDIVVTIETFERVWNKDTGLFENGAPMDINDLQDRFVQLRLNEIKVEHDELMNENK